MTGSLTKREIFQISDETFLLEKGGKPLRHRLLSHFMVSLFLGCFLVVIRPAVTEHFQKIFRTNAISEHFQKTFRTNAISEHFQKTFKFAEKPITPAFQRHFFKCAPSESPAAPQISADWGSRSHEFESRHSDQQSVLKSSDFRTLSFYLSGQSLGVQILTTEGHAAALLFHSHNRFYAA